MSYASGGRGGRGADRDGQGGSKNRTGAARRTYPMDGPGPRVGRVTPGVPRAERVDGAPEQDRRPGDYAGNRRYDDRRPANRDGRRFDEPRDDRAFADPKKRNEAARARRMAEHPRDLPPVEPADTENLLCGRNPIREALRAGRPVEKLLVAQGDLSGAARDIIGMAREAGVIVQMVDRTRLDQIYPAHQGLLAYVAAVPYSTVDEMLADAEAKGEDPFLILLDGITDPHNLGAIIRTAECVGAHGVIIPERRAAGLTPAAAKATAGALNFMKIARVTNLNRTIDELKEKGIWIIGTAMDGQSALTADLTGPAALVIGSEGDGISKLTLEKCDLKVTLPMKGHIESLNASVAAGVLMYEIARARSL